MLDVKSLRCVSYEAAVPQNATQARKREPYMEVSWKPDVTTLTSSQAVQAHPHVQSEIDAAGKMVELINHKGAIGSVLLLGDSSIEFVDELKQYLPPTTAFTIGCLSTKALDHLQSSIQDYQSSTLLLSEDLSEWSETIKEKHGLLILGECMLQAKKKKRDLLDAVKPFIAENGSLISVVKDSSDNNFAKALSLCGYSDLGFQFRFSNSSVFYSQLSDSKSNVQDTDEKVVIVTMDPQRPSIQGIARQLRARGCNVHTENTSKVEISEATKIIIDEAEGTMISELRNDIFEALQEILCSSLPVVWLTSGVNQGEVISGGMSQGFLRAIRSEQAAAQITLLDVDVDESPECIGESSTRNSEMWQRRTLVKIPSSGFIKE